MKRYACLAVVASVMVLGAQEPRQLIIQNPTVPLLTYVRPEIDTQVILTSPQPQPQRLREDPGVETRAHFLGALSQLVLVIRVERVNGVPSLYVETPPTADPIFDWTYAATSEDKATRIVSNITARIERVLKGDAVLKAGDVFYLQEGFGTAMLRGVTVQTRVSWLDMFEAGKRYLLFGSFKPVEDQAFKGDPKFFRNEAYGETPDGLLVRTHKDTRTDDEFETMTLDQAVAHVEREMLK